MLRAEWVDLAKQVIVEILQQEYAATVREIEARAANNLWPSAGGRRIDPDFLTEARRELAQDGVVRRVSAPTRGGRQIGTWHLVTDAGIRTAIGRTARRKRLLTARHEGWAATSERNPKGLIGQAGETVVRRLLERLDPYSHIVWDAGHVLGTNIPGGNG